MLHLLVPCLLLAEVHGQPTKPPTCCGEKTVGGVRYMLVGSDPSGLTEELQCVSPCVFMQEGKPDSKFCFKHGDLEVECQDDMVLTTPSGPTEDPEDDDITKTVKSLIDAGTCTEVTYATYSNTSGKCGDTASSYYREFTYNGKRVLVSNNVPDHPAESDALSMNPNLLCEGWQFVQLEIDPTVTLPMDTVHSTSAAPIGYAITGGIFLNNLANPSGALAFTMEGPSLDSCTGHSAPAVPPVGAPPSGPPPVGEAPTAGKYHYHANINCTNAGAATGASDPSQCKLIGYYRDGIPVYGLCRSSSGQMMTSCYKLKAGSTTTSITTAFGTYSGLGAMESDYTYSSDASCNLDEASGALHPVTGKYSYFGTTSFPWTPLKVMAAQAAVCGIASL